MAAAQDLDTGPVVDGPGHSDLRRNRRHDGRYADDDQHCGYEKNVAVDEANLRLADQKDPSANSITESAPETAASASPLAFGIMCCA